MLFRELFQALILKGKKMSNNLVPFERVKEIVNSLESKKIVKYEGSIGTEESILGSPYQIVRFEVVYSAEEKNEEKDS